MKRWRAKPILLVIIAIKISTLTPFEIAVFLKMLAEIDAYRLLPYLALIHICNVLEHDYQMMQKMVKDACSSKMPKVIASTWRLALIISYVLLLFSLKP